MKGFMATVLFGIMVSTTLVALLVHSAMQSLGQIQ